LLRHHTYIFSLTAFPFAPLQVLPQCRAGLHLKPHNVFKVYRCGMRKTQPISRFSRQPLSTRAGGEFRPMQRPFHPDRPIIAHASRARLNKVFFLHIVFACLCRFRAYPDSGPAPSFFRREAERPRLRSIRATLTASATQSYKPEPYRHMPSSPSSTPGRSAAFRPASS
jgi:hypothetical protein